MRVGAAMRPCTTPWREEPASAFHVVINSGPIEHRRTAPRTITIVQCSHISARQSQRRHRHHRQFESVVQEALTETDNCKQPQTNARNHSGQPASKHRT